MSAERKTREDAAHLPPLPFLLVSRLVADADLSLSLSLALSLSRQRSRLAPRAAPLSQAATDTRATTRRARRRGPPPPRERPSRAAAAACRRQPPSAHAHSRLPSRSTRRSASTAMHPQLVLKDNPHCAELILAFQKCHDDGGYWGRLTGLCNEHKTLLDKCFKAQKKLVRKGILVKAREDRERWQAKCEQLEDS